MVNNQPHWEGCGLKMGRYEVCKGQPANSDTLRPGDRAGCGRK
jgi:hypothetical protein